MQNQFINLNEPTNNWITHFTSLVNNANQLAASRNQNDTSLVTTQNRISRITGRLGIFGNNELVTSNSANISNEVPAGLRAIVEESNRNVDNNNHEVIADHDEVNSRHDEIRSLRRLGNCS